MKNLHLLPTNKPSRLVWYTTGKYHLLKEPIFIDAPLKPSRHIYITSDERPNSDEYYIIDDIYDEVLKNDFLKFIDNNCKKIILTTDPELIKDGVQEINDEFLEWFIKNPNCDFVRTLKVPYFDESSHSYVLIIPKEEEFELVSIGEETIKLAIPMMQDKEEIKQETLEEAAKNYGKIRNELDYGQIYCNSVDSFKAGAKWQQEQNKNLKP